MKDTDHDIQEFRNFKEELEKAFSKLMKKEIHIIMISPINEKGELTISLKDDWLRASVMSRRFVHFLLWSLLSIIINIDEDNHMAKEEKAETLTKIIELKNRVDNHDKEIHTVKTQIKDINEKIQKNKDEEVIERRKLENKIKRSIWEVLEMAKGNRKTIEEHSHRIEDSKERLDQLQDIVKWALRLLLGLFITTIIGALLRIFIA